MRGGGRGRERVERLEGHCVMSLLLRVTEVGF